MNIVCAGYLVRHPVGGHVWHHLQYLVGLKRLGHRVTYFEHFTIPDFCYNPTTFEYTSDPTYGIEYLVDLLRPHGMEHDWCYIREDETGIGMDRQTLAHRIAEADLFLNLSNINWIPEIETCRKRVLIDTDPVFTQIDAHGCGGDFGLYDAHFTYGENVHQPGCEMPHAGYRWMPTRQPVVLDLWPVTPGHRDAPITTVMNWRAFGDFRFNGRLYGQKDRQFAPFLNLPRELGGAMELASKVPEKIQPVLEDGGWRVFDPIEVTLRPSCYQAYIQRSKAEFCVAKHAYVSTRCGWFSDRSSAYLASGRPVVTEDTGYSRWIPTGQGLLSFTTREEAVAALQDLDRNYDLHCRAARELATAYFDSGMVLNSIIERTFQP